MPLIIYSFYTNQKEKAKFKRSERSIYLTMH